MSSFHPSAVARAARRAGSFLALIAVSSVGVAANPSFAAVASDSSAAPALLSATAVAGESATVRLGNRDIAVFRARLLGYTPAQRADAAQERLRGVLRGHARSDSRVRVDVTPSELGWLYFVDDQWVFSLTAADVDTLAGDTVPAAVQRTRSNLEGAVAAHIGQRSVSGLVRSILYSILATVVLWVLLRGLVRVSRWSSRRVDASLQERTKRLHLPPSAPINQISSLIRGITRVGGIILALALVDVWLTFVLKQFPYTYPWGDQIDDYLITAVSRVGLAILHAIPDLVMLVLIVLVARFVLRWVRLFFEAVREGRISPLGLDAETAVPAQRLVILFLWVLTFAIAYPFIPGSQGVAFKGVSVLAGLMLSLGSSNVISQAASGYMLMFSKALRVNDYVRIGEYEGTVMSVGVLSTKIRTPRDEEINVPNAVVVGTITKNYSRLNLETGAPVTTAVTIGYGTPWRQVHAMLQKAAERTPGLRKSPEPRVLQTALSDFFVEYTLFARLEEPQTRVRVLSVLHSNIQDIFNEYGVQIMSPHYEGDPDGKVWVPKEKWHEAPAEPHAEAAARSNPKGSA